MIREQNALVRTMFYVLLVMIGILAALIALNLRKPYAGLMFLSQEEGGVKTYGHIDSYGLTEVVQDENGDGINENHIYRVAVTGDVALLNSVMNESDNQENPDAYVLQFTSKKQAQRSVGVSITENDETGLYHECNISFSEGVAKPDTSYSDWNFDGRIDVEHLERGAVMNVRMGNRWLPVLMDRPRVHREYVSVTLDGVESRLNFLDGEFVTATQ